MACTTCPKNLHIFGVDTEDVIETSKVLVLPFLSLALSKFFSVEWSKFINEKSIL